jgi:RNA polymerase sigma-70 factor (ECF subfamily)
MPATDGNNRPTGLLQPEERFARLWTRAQPRVAAYVRSILPDPHLADDILQDVAVTCMRKIEEYDTSRSFAAWCVGIARIQILRYRREAQRYRLLEHMDILEAVADVQEDMTDETDVRTAALRQCLRTVSGKTKQLLDLRYTGKHSHASIAGLLRLQTDSVKVMLSRARASLRECIEKRLANGTA